MKIKIKRLDYDAVMALPRPKHKKPKKPNLFWRALIRLLSVPDLSSAKFSYRIEGELPKEPSLILMNHSSFVDLKLFYGIFFPKPVCIVGTEDGFVGKAWLMRQIGCIPTQKFVTDLTLIKDIKYALTKKKCHVLMFPEAGYSFDGRATALPSKQGGLLKLLDVPVVTVTTEGAFLREPLYNELKKRKNVRVRATVKPLLSRKQIAAMTVPELDRILKDAFSFDAFERQREERIVVDAPFRADGLERILYKCPKCCAEGEMRGEGTAVTCRACGQTYEMSEYGEMRAQNGETEFSHIPDWFDWERACVRQEIERGEYRLDTEVEIGMLVDHKALYLVGEGRLVQDESGFTLTGCDGRLRYTQSPLSAHTLNADYYWYEIGDVIGIGNRDALYYCFPKTPIPVAKARFAAEELYRMKYKR